MTGALAVLFLAAVYGFANWQRGRGADARLVGMNRWECAAFVSVLTMPAALPLLGPLAAFKVGLVVFPGFFLYLVAGWGVYFSAFTGSWSGAKGFPPVDWIVLKLFPLGSAYQLDVSTRNYLRGTVAMTLRGLLAAPMFWGLAFALHAPSVASLGGVGALQGPVYAANRWFYRKYGTAVPETVMGLIIGAAVGLAICQAEG